MLRSKVQNSLFQTCPGGCSSADLVGALKGYGEILNTYISRKYDQLGKRFGFVTFKKVRDAAELGTRLKDVWIGSYKLFIVLARFVDGEKIPRKEEKQWKPVMNEGTNLHQVRVEHAIDNVGNVVVNQGVGNRSFLDTLLNKEVDSGMPVMNIDQNVIALSDWYEWGLVGRVKSFDILTALKRSLKDMTDVRINIKYVGGLNVFLLFQSSEDKNVFHGDIQLWKVLFDGLEVWNGQRVEFERLAWLKLHGIPLSLLCKQVMDDIAAKFGVVVQSAELPEGGNDLSYGYVGVLMKSVDRVNQKYMLNWRGNSFVVLVEEEVGEWSPDCLVDLDEDGYSLSKVHVGMEEEPSGNGGNEVHEELSCNDVNEVEVDPKVTDDDNAQVNGSDRVIEDVFQGVIRHH
ncbi:putative RNA recognition motif domain, nucleotide-binding alpha-beta plait domain superfamily [Helianthus annuus]|nr:putative RNA recognition motif domain, nucleotide-binding alpha-beta plait domain superfamily [Helianthus annuus]